MKQRTTSGRLRFKGERIKGDATIGVLEKHHAERISGAVKERSTKLSIRPVGQNPRFFSRVVADRASQRRGIVDGDKPAVAERLRGNRKHGSGQ